MRVLLAIAEADARGRIRASLRRGGFDDIAEAASSQDAISALECDDGGPDYEAALIDMDLSGADGVETCANIRLMPRHRDTPLVVLATPGDVDSLSQAFVAGASDYLFKPFHDIELLARMRSIQRNKVQLDRRRAYERELQRLRRPASIWRAADGPIVDPETGQFGRQALTEILNWHGQRDDDLPIMVLVAQVDALTSYRHLHGADGARAMLNAVAARLGADSARLGDMLFAFEAGGFALVAAPVHDDAERRAERLRRSILDLRIPHCESALRDCVSLSIGVASGRRCGRDAVAQLLPGAIRAAEQAAAEGGDRVISVEGMA